MTGILHKVGQQWLVLYSWDLSRDGWKKLPLNPYDEESLTESDISKYVEFEIEDFWETGLEEVFKVAKLK